MTAAQSVTPTNQLGQIDPRFGEVDTVFFIVGAQKAGTTWLYRQLRNHPQVAMPGWKETNYWTYMADQSFGKHFDKMYRARFKNMPAFTDRLLRRGSKSDKSIDLSMRLVKRANAHPGRPHSGYANVMFQEVGGKTRAVGEACPQYALLPPETYSEMASLGKDVRFIYLMRDPVRRLVSGVKHSLRLERGVDNFSQDDVEQTIAELIERPNSFHMRSCNYRDNVGRLETAISTEKIKYVFFEDLFSDAMYGEILTFLGVSHHRPNIAARVNADPNPRVGISPELELKAIAALGDIYRFSIDRFGDALPSRWTQSLGLLDEGHVNA